jgi:SAM-dependent methyltransferase
MASGCGEYPVGQALVDWIDRSEDFPLSKAHEINTRHWTKQRGRRFSKFLEVHGGGWAAMFLDNPWQKVEGPLLEVGCAGGHNLEYFAAKGIRPLFGIDATPAYVEKARARVPRASIQLGDFLNLPFESGSLGSIVARGTLHVTTTKGLLASLREAHRVLKQGGLMYINTRIKPALLERGRERRLSLFTYLIYKMPKEQRPGGERPRLCMVRNFVPEPQLTSLIASLGFLPLGDPPARLFTTRDDRGDVRESVSYVCMKTPAVRH